MNISQGSSRRAKIFKILALVIACVVCVTAVAGYFINRSIEQVFGMTNQVYQETVSPNGKYVATLANSDGSVLPDGFEYLSLSPTQGWRHLQSNDPIPKDEVAEMDAAGIQSVAWKNGTTLVVKYATDMPSDFVMKAQKWHDVSIIYLGINHTSTVTATKKVAHH